MLLGFCFRFPSRVLFVSFLGSSLQPLKGDWFCACVFFFLTVTFQYSTQKEKKPANLKPGFEITTKNFKKIIIIDSFEKPKNLKLKFQHSNEEEGENKRK